LEAAARARRCHCYFDFAESWELDMKITATDDTSKAAKVTLDGNVAAISAGGSGSGASLALTDAKGVARVAVDGANGILSLNSDQGKTRVTLDGAAGYGAIGGNTVNGFLCLFPASATNDRDLTQATMTLSGQVGGISLGTAQGQRRIGLDGSMGYAALGANGGNGIVSLFPAAATNDHVDSTQATVTLTGQNGAISLNNLQGKARITLDGSRAYGAFGGNAWDGGLALFPAAATNNSNWGQATMTFNGQVAVAGIGGAGHNGTLNVNNAAGQPAVTINGATGDILLANADCAEDFDLAGDVALEPGTVVVLDDSGGLRESAIAYDRRVAGVLSGAGAFKPGLVLDRRPAIAALDGGATRAPVALMGKVYCKVDASYGAIRTGDLLTTSPTPGHAMSATDRSRAFGAVIGKALQPLEGGQGFIPILVTLQ
jgi:hypothetical protein